MKNNTLADPLEHIYRAFLASDGISTDSREELRNRIFVALEGENFDGNQYVEEALGKACSLALTSRRDLEGSERVVVVEDTLSTLQSLARHHRLQLPVKVVAITGSNGKTTSKELLTAVLSRKFRVQATRGNLNNHIGVPLTLLALSGDEEFAIVEMGANHPGEIALLSNLAMPDLGLITNIGKAHLEGFGSLKGVLEAKGELYDHLAASAGFALVDSSDSLLVGKAGDSGVKTLLVGEKDDIKVGGKILSQKPCLDVELVLEGQVQRLETPLVGEYNLQNIRMAAACGLHLGVPHGDIVEALASYVPSNNRSQLVKGRSNRVVLDAYNANPSSMKSAVSSLIEYAGGAVVLILGDMAELGKESQKEHRELVDWLAVQRTGQILLAGEQFSMAVGSRDLEGFRTFSDVPAIEAHLREKPLKDSLILLKGSRVMGLERLLNILTD